MASKIDSTPRKKPTNKKATKGRLVSRPTRAEADKAQYALADAYNAIKAATGLRIETLRNLANASLNRSDKIAAELRGVTVASLAREAE